MFIGNDIAQKTFSYNCEIKADTIQYIIDMSSRKNKRELNEDSLGLWTSAKNDVTYVAVADGLGGHLHGEKASHFAVNKLHEYTVNEEITKDNFELKLTSILTRISTEMRELDTVRFSTPWRQRDTTVIVAAIFPDCVKAVNIGDSTAKFLSKSLRSTVREGEGRYVSHTLATLCPTELRFYTWDIEQDFYLLLYTDGCDEVDPEWIGLLGDKTPETAENITTSALLSSTDNTTAITIRGIVK